MHNNKTPRRIAIIIAAMLGLLALLYISGLLAQMQTSYQAWLSQGGLDGSAVMRAPDFSPITC
jgi:hypothetical protein